MADTRELLEMRFMKFLHYASERPCYIPGDRFFYKCYTKDNTPSLHRLIEMENPLSIVDKIISVKNKKTSAWPDALVFALAACSMQSNSQELQNRAYKSLRAICKTGRDILLYVKFCRDIKGNQGNLGGNGFKRALANWYLVWMPFDLADILFYQRSYFGWSHRDVLKLAHIKPLCEAQAVLFAYVIGGPKKMEEKYGESTDEDVVELIQYGTAVDKLRSLEDPVMTAHAARIELPNLERVPKKNYNNREVCNELIPHMDVDTLLRNLQRFARHGFLQKKSLTVLKVKDVLNNLSKAEKYEGHPSRVYIEMRKYQKAPHKLYMMVRRHYLNLASKLKDEEEPIQKPPETNKFIMNALDIYFHDLFKFRKPTGKRFLVAMDVRREMFTRCCYHSRYLSPAEAAQVIALSLVKVEPDGNVTVGIFSKGDPRNVSFFQAYQFKQKYNMGTYSAFFGKQYGNAAKASVATAINWASENNQPIDVFVILSDHTVITRDTRTAIHQYRNIMNLPDSKVFTCSLTGKLKKHKQVEGLKMMYVAGFDERVCSILSAFACSEF